MRVNHVGEVCAQALYQAQALTARDPALRAADGRRRRARRPTTWPGRSSGWTSWATGPACSTRCGTPAPSASACWPGGPATRSAWASSSRPSARSSSIWPATWTACRPPTPRRAPSSTQMKADEAPPCRRRPQDAGRAGLPAPVRWAMRGAARVMTAPRTASEPAGPRRAAGSGLDDLVAGRDLGRLGQHDAGRAVLLVRQRDRALPPPPRAGRGRVTMKCMWMRGEHLGVGLGALGLQLDAGSRARRGGRACRISTTS